MTNRRNILLALIAVLTLTAGAALAQPGGGRGPGPDGDEAFGPRMAKALDLTEAQTAQIKALREEHRGEMSGKRKDMMRLRHELKGLMLEDDVNKSKVVDLTRKVGDMRTELQVARAEMRLKVRELLTEEQRDIMTTMKHRRGGKGRGNGAGCDQPCDRDGSGRGQRNGRRN